ncbi:hypothetical protein B0A48_17167 [Cryoendolithus antarcticus]|uniref:Uncharacterized protein n=1 Tax=Cryoendolithus antarcticus TaxID=1507870 RepID=A0A1V8SCC1_9PEZI|nr:hypothetical protein B0A48_17167 [Cryoendolithus antarcticus]
MCIYTKFRYLCQCIKLKISSPCHKAGLNSCGQLVCMDDPHPRITDNVYGDGVVRARTAHTFGVGVCGNVQCQWWFGLLPVGDYGGAKSLEDDTSIDTSDESRAAREDLWYRTVLSTEQQLEHFSTQYTFIDSSIPNFASGGQSGMNHFWPFTPSPHEQFVEEVKWHHLNPGYLSAELLQVAVWMRLLPASIVSGLTSRSISPLRPIKGPFAVAKHNCRKSRAMCKLCGEFTTPAHQKARTLAYQQRISYRELHDEALSHEDWMTTIAEWDDEANRWKKVTQPVQGKKYKTIWELDALLPHLPEPCVGGGHDAMLYEISDEEGSVYDERDGVEDGMHVMVRTGLVAGRYGVIAAEESAAAPTQQHETERVFDEFVMFPVDQQATVAGLDTGAFDFTSSRGIVKPGLKYAGGVEQLDDGMETDFIL